MPSRRATIHPLVIRLTHWFNFVALYIMVASGMRIYNASPILDFSFPEWMTLGGWLAGARQWHFLTMWLFLVNGIVWVMYNVLTRHGRDTTLFRKRDIGGVLPMINYYLRRAPHPKTGKYNALQKSAYTALPFVGLLAVLSGVAIYWPVQAQWLTAFFGDYDAARVWHFGAMAALVLFFLSHIVLVALAGWKNFTGMITGRGDVLSVEEHTRATGRETSVERASVG